MSYRKYLGMTVAASMHKFSQILVQSILIHNHIYFLFLQQ